jgi:hypothetical protein
MSYLSERPTKGVRFPFNDKSAFYEQVTGVKISSLFFPFIEFLLLFVSDFVALHVALHRVSIRTLDELCLLTHQD